MKATVFKQALIQALSQMSTAFNANAKAPQKDSVCIIAADNRLEIQSAIQLPILGVVSTTIPADIATDGKAFIYGKKLLNLVKLMSGDNITLEVTTGKAVFNIYTTVSDGKSSYRFAGSEFEDQTADNTTTQFTCTTTSFKAAVEKVIGNTEKFGYLGYSENLKTSVNCSVKENLLTLQATNGKKLSKVVCEIDNPAKINTEFNIYNIALETVLKNVKSAEKITFGVDESKVVFQVNGLTISTMQVKNLNYPDTSNFFEDTYKTALVYTEEFVRAVKNSAIFAKDNKHKAVYLHFDKEHNFLEIRSYSDEGAAIENLHAEVYEDAEIILSLDNLEVIKNIKTKKMRVEVYPNERLCIADENGNDKHIATGTRTTLEELKKDCIDLEKAAQIEPPTIDVTAEIMETVTQVTKFEIGKTYNLSMEGITDDTVTAEFTVTKRTDTDVIFANDNTGEMTMSIQTDCGVEKILNAVWSGTAEDFAA